MRQKTIERRPYIAPRLTRFGTVRERTRAVDPNAPIAGFLVGGAEAGVQCTTFGSGAYCWS
jgi:hypothetical protein